MNQKRPLRVITGKLGTFSGRVMGSDSKGKKGTELKYTIEFPLTEEVKEVLHHMNRVLLGSFSSYSA